MIFLRNAINLSRYWHPLRKWHGFYLFFFSGADHDAQVVYQGTGSSIPVFWQKHIFQMELHKLARLLLAQLINTACGHTFKLSGAQKQKREVS